MSDLVRVGLLVLLFVSTGAVAGPESDALALFAPFPGLAKSPPPSFTVLHSLTVGSTRIDGLNTGYSVNAVKTTLSKTALPGVVHTRGDIFTRNVLVTSPNTSFGKLTDSESVGQSEGIALYGGLLVVNFDSTYTNAKGERFGTTNHLERVDIQGDLFPLEVGKKMTYSYRVQIANSTGTPPLTSDAVAEYVVKEKMPVFERDDVRIDGGIVRIEVTTRGKLTSNTSNRYYSEKYQWVVAADFKTLGTTGFGTELTTVPVYILESTASPQALADLQKYDVQLLAIQRSTAQEYLGPRLPALFAMVPGGGKSNYSQGAAQPTQGAADPLAALDCANSIGAAVKRTLLGYGLSYLAEHSENLTVKGLADAGAQSVRNCRI